MHPGPEALTAMNAMPAMRGGTRPLRVALCHLESLVCLPAINRLFTQMGNEIGLVILSDRFGSRHGGPLRQFAANVRRSGVRLTVWLGFDIVAAQVTGRMGAWVEKLTRRRPRLASARVLAQRHGARVLDVADINGGDATAAVRAYAPDVVLVMNFDQILRQEFIATVAGPIINAHPSLLPALRGPCPVYWALVEARTEAGVTLHLIEDEKIDAGALLVQRATPLDPSSSVAETTAELFELAVALVPEALRTLPMYLGHRQPQDPTKASYRGFPDRANVARSRSAGIRLCRFRQVAALIARAAGIAN